MFFFICSSCSSQNEEQVSRSVNFYYMSDMFATNVLFIDIEESSGLYATPTINVGNEGLDERKIVEYISRITILKWGEDRYIRIGFRSVNDFGIMEIHRLILNCQKHIAIRYPEFDGTLQVIFYYSSKGNEWLILPPPPENN